MGNLVIAGSGHRPQSAAIGKLKPFTKEMDNAMFLAAKVYFEMIADSIDYVISGGALGWDMAIARAAYSLKIPYHVYIPFEGFEQRWPKASQDKFHKMCELAADTRLISNSQDVRALYARNRAMVDNCDALFILWNGKKSGGTWHCICYALDVIEDTDHENAKPDLLIFNGWDSYVKYS